MDRQTQTVPSMLMPAECNQKHCTVAMKLASNIIILTHQCSHGLEDHMVLTCHIHHSARKSLVPSLLL